VRPRKKRAACAVGEAVWLEVWLEANSLCACGSAASTPVRSPVVLLSGMLTGTAGGGLNRLQETKTARDAGSNRLHLKTELKTLVLTKPP
jgi:hypothetical protein